ncbi:MAG: hypothetical protein JNG88_05275 [Phycisphaerales bacterium]|nr:hypothetical protein [Phycisphaerales bacterium]
MRRDRAALAFVLIACNIAFDAEAVAQSQSPDEALWHQIEAARKAPVSTQPYDDWFVAQRAACESLAQRLRTYLTLYPGGPHRDEAATLELQSLFDIGCLSDGKLSELRVRAEEHLRSPLSPVCEQEAAYWLMICRRRDRAATTPPAALPLELLDVNLADEYHSYVMAYPAARRTPRLATLVLDAALARDDPAAMREMANLLEMHFPSHANTAYCRGSVRRFEQVGRQFEYSMSTIAHGRQDGKTLRGRPIVIVVWLAQEDRNVRSAIATTRPSGYRERELALRDLVAFAREHPLVSIVGVPIADSVSAVREATTAAGIDWPQHFDERGWAGEFVRHWGVRTAPFVFVIDAKGVLRAATDGAGWRAAANEAAAP